MNKRTTKSRIPPVGHSKVSSKYQIVIPKAIRVRLGIKRGDEVTLLLRDEDEAVVTKRPKSVVESLRGLGSEVWEALGGADKYLEEERHSWDEE